MQHIDCFPQKIKSIYSLPNLRRLKPTDMRSENDKIRNIQRWLGYVKNFRSKFSAQAEELQ